MQQNYVFKKKQSKYNNEMFILCLFLLGGGPLDRYLLDWPNSLFIFKKAPNKLFGQPSIVQAVLL